MNWLPKFCITPMCRLLRQALELLFVKYEDVLKGSKPGKARK